jgi:hypothetical protein
MAWRSIGAMGKSLIMEADSKKAYRTEGLAWLLVPVFFHYSITPCRWLASHLIRNIENAISCRNPETQ